MSQFRVLFTLLLILVIPNIAFAAGGTPISGAIDWVLDLLTNGIARSVAILTIVMLGYMSFAGRLSAEFVAKVIFGLVLIFGSATLVDLMIAAVTS